MNTRTANDIRTTNIADYNAWLSQVTAYNMPSDDNAFVAWWTALEQQSRGRLAALLAR